MKEKITYKLNKLNLLINIGIILLLGVFGVLFFLFPSVLVSTIFRNESLIRFIGGGIGIMSLFLLVGYINLFNKNYGLILSQDGIYNNSNLTNVGIINWREISKIKVKEFKKNKLILIFVKNNKTYYKKMKNPIVRINLWAYNQFYETSFVIEPKNIDCTFEELEKAIREGFKDYKEREEKSTSKPV